MKKTQQNTSKNNMGKDEVSGIDLPESCIEFLKNSGYSVLYPTQRKAIDAGILDGRSILICTPTASGKTLVAMLAMLKQLSENPTKKVVYLTPLRALAAEKYREFKRIEKEIDFGDVDIRVNISTGDFDQPDYDLYKNNVIIMTNEKMDSILRHGAEWINQIGLVIADEVHLLGDEGRGPTLEIVLSKLKSLVSRLQVIALSATVSNSDEIARWLECGFLDIQWRPVPLVEGVYEYGTVITNDGKQFETNSSSIGPAADLALDSIKNGGQALVFAETRARSISLAKKCAEAMAKSIVSKTERTQLKKISKKLIDENERTEQVDTLYYLLERATAFHHAGLSENARSIVENEFISGKIRILASTPTLAAGVNLPARRVIISSITRFDPKFGGSKPISVLEYKQLCGRAGRPQYDKSGEAIVITGNSGPSSEDVFDSYINGTPEPIESKLTHDRPFRIHTLSLVLSNPGIKDDEIVDFFSSALVGFQTSKNKIKFNVKKTLDFLKSEDLVKRKEQRFIATEFGKLTSLLYLDPVAAVEFRKAVRIAASNKGKKERKHTLGFMHTITDCEDFFPKFGLRNKEYELATNLLDTHYDEVIEEITEYQCNRSLLALHEWANETSELDISKNLGVEPGDMHRIVESAKWLSHCLHSICKLEYGQNDSLTEELSILRSRISQGIKPELIELVRIKGIGRTRARILFKHNIKNIQDLSNASKDDLAKIEKIGDKVAQSIKTQLKKMV